MDVLSALPRDTNHVRHLLFTLPLPFSLSQANHELFWPLVDNIYAIRNSENVPFHVRDSRAAHVRHRVICRFKRTRAAPLVSQGKRILSSKRIISGYDVSFLILAFPKYYEYHLVRQLRDLDLVTCLQHVHSLDESDAAKRNSFLRKLVGAEVANGYPPAAVISSLTGQGRANARVRLASAGGTYLTRQDVINAGLTWRLADPNRLWVVVSAKDDVNL
jgi:hypothetical protein